MVATSCKKKTDEGSSFNVSLEPVKGFVAGESFDGSKAYIDPTDWAMKWNDGDQIMVYNLDAADYTQSVCHVFDANSGSEGKTKTGFHGVAVGPAKSGGYFYFYHANKASGNIQADNKETFTVSETQTCNKPFYGTTYFCDPSSIVMACPIQTIYNNDFTMQHIFGFLNIGIAGTTSGFQTKKVTSITLTDGAWNLNGTVSLKLLEVNPNSFNTAMEYLVASTGEDSNPAYQTYLTYLQGYLNTLGYHANGAGKTITLNLEGVAGGGVDINWHEWKNFFIAVRPGAFYRGFTITVNFADGNSISYNPVGNGSAMDWLIKPGYFRNYFIRL